MADRDPKPENRPRGADRVRRVNAKRPADVAITLSPSGEDRTEAIVAWLARQIRSGQGSPS